MFRIKPIQFILLLLLRRLPPLLLHFVFVFNSDFVTVPSFDFPIPSAAATMGHPALPRRSQARHRVPIADSTGLSTFSDPPKVETIHTGPARSPRFVAAHLRAAPLCRGPRHPSGSDVIGAIAAAFHIRPDRWQMDTADY